MIDNKELVTPSRLACSTLASPFFTTYHHLPNVRAFTLDVHKYWVLQSIHLLAPLHLLRYPEYDGESCLFFVPLLYMSNLHFLLLHFKGR